MHCQVPGIDYSLSKLAIHAALESATAVALSHTGILYIAETDEKKINRVRQVRDKPEYCCKAFLLSVFSGNRTAGQVVWVYLRYPEIVLGLQAQCSVKVFFYCFQSLF